MPNEVTPTQADRECAEKWAFIECMRCSEYSGYFTADLADDIAAHRIAHEAPLLAENDRRADCIGVLQRKRDELLARIAELEAFAEQLSDRDDSIGDDARAALKQGETK